MMTLTQAKQRNRQMRAELSTLSKADLVEITQMRILPMDGELLQSTRFFLLRQRSARKLLGIKYMRVHAHWRGRASGRGQRRLPQGRSLHKGEFTAPTPRAFGAMRLRM
jgi:hypothetical protein